MRLAAPSLIFLAMTLGGCGTAAAPSSTNAESAAVAPAETVGIDSDRAAIAKPTLHAGDVWVDRISGSDREFRIEDVQQDGTMDVNFWAPK